MATPTNTSALLQVDAAPFGTGTTLNAGFTFTAGCSAILLVSHYCDDGTPLTAVTIGGTAATQVAVADAGASDVHIWFVQSMAGGTANIGFNFSGGGNYVSAAVIEWGSGVITGLDTGTPNTSTGISAAPTVSTGATTSQASTVVVALTAPITSITNNALTGPSGWAAVFTEQNSSAHQAGRGAWKEESSAGTKTATFAMTSNEWIAAIAAFKLNAGATSYTLTADQGTYTLTGQATLAKRVMMGGQGSFGLSGQDAALSKSGGTYSVTADVGLYTLFGSEAQRDLSMTADRGLFALTGQVSNFLRGYRLTAAQADFLLTGRSSTLSYSQAPATPVSVSATGGTVFLDSGAVYVVSSAGRTKWVDYIPVRQVAPGSNKTSTFAQDGAIPVTMLANVTGLREWVDYIPVVEVANSANVWRTEADGWLPIISV